MFSVIFDMDGTLLDTQKICIPAWDYAGELQGFKNLGKHIPEVCGMNQTGWTNFLKSRYKTLNIENFVTRLLYPIFLLCQVINNIFLEFSVSLWYSIFVTTAPLHF